MTQKKKVAPPKGRLPLPANSTPADVLRIGNEQTSHVKSHPDYGSQPGVQEATVRLEAGLTALGIVLGKLSLARKEVSTLEGERDALLGSVHRDHDHLETALLQLAAGDPKALVAWGLTVVARARAPHTRSAPQKLSLSINGTPGTVIASCEAEGPVRAFLFQHGSDPSNPDAWPEPVLAPGPTCEIAGLAVGKTEYFRVAAFRGPTGRSEWSDVVGFLVR